MSSLDFSTSGRAKSTQARRGLIKHIVERTSVPSDRLDVTIDHAASRLNQIIVHDDGPASGTWLTDTTDAQRAVLARRVDAAAAALIAAADARREARIRADIEGGAHRRFTRPRADRPVLACAETRAPARLVYTAEERHGWATQQEADAYLAAHRADILTRRMPMPNGTSATVQDVLATIYDAATARLTRYAGGVCPVVGAATHMDELHAYRHVDGRWHLTEPEIQIVAVPLYDGEVSAKRLMNKRNAKSSSGFYAQMNGAVDAAMRDAYGAAFLDGSGRTRGMTVPELKRASRDAEAHDEVIVRVRRNVKKTLTREMAASRASARAVVDDARDEARMTAQQAAQQALVWQEEVQGVQADRVLADRERWYDDMEARHEVDVEAARTQTRADADARATRRAADRYAGATRSGADDYAYDVRAHADDYAYDVRTRCEGAAADAELVAASTQTIRDALHAAVRLRDAARVTRPGRDDDVHAVEHRLSDAERAAQAAIARLDAWGASHQAAQPGADDGYERG